MLTLTCQVDRVYEWCYCQWLWLWFAHDVSGRPCRDVMCVGASGRPCLRVVPGAQGRALRGHSEATVGGHRVAPAHPGNGQTERERLRGSLVEMSREAFVKSPASCATAQIREATALWPTCAGAFARVHQCESAGLCQSQAERKRRAHT